MSDFDEYQKWTRFHAFYAEPDANSYLGLGLASEAGEVATILKRRINDPRHLGGSFEQARSQLKAELGDVLWYVSRIADEWGIPLEAVVDHNVDKLDRRNAERLAALTQQEIKFNG